MDDTSRPQAEPLPLDGVRVLELAQMVAGPSAGLLLADYGAEVLKIEPPAGDGARHLRSTAAAALPDSPVFTAYNRNKRSARLDLRDSAAARTVLALVEQADVVIESSRPGAMDALGLGPDAVLARNPRVVYASVSGFGHGPTGHAKRGVDIIVQAESGLMSTTGPAGGPPTKVGFTVVDAACGHALCHGILAALLRRSRTGRGGLVRISLYDVALSLQTGPLTEYAMTGTQMPRSGNSAPLTAPADLLRCADGDVIVSAYLPEHWIAFTDTIGAPELRADPRFGDSVSRARNRVALIGLIEERLRTGTVAEWLSRLHKAGVLVARVKDYADVLADPLTTESGAVLTGDPAFGVRNPVDLAGSTRPDAWQRVELAPEDVEAAW